MPGIDIILKRVLIISPHFPPVNSADMHRVRLSIPHFKELGWEPVVIAVQEAYVETNSLDPLLLHTIPKDVEVHKVKAFDIKRTRKLGLGSLSIRSYFQIKKKGTELLRKQRFDLIYFSTTAFHVMALGPYWKKKFGIPFVLDIQDPWRSDFYLDKPKSERPPKFFISYSLDKYLEKRTVPFADGIVSVSQGYCDTFITRYPVMQKEQFEVITFGASFFDFEISEKYITYSDKVDFSNENVNIVYVGRGGHDLQFALNIIFGAFLKGLKEETTLFSNVHFWFIGTSYAAAGTGVQTIIPIAESYGIGEYVTEITDRIPYFETLYLLKKADILLVPGSTDTMYTASKIYPYILAEKPLLAVFYKESSVVSVLKDTRGGKVVVFDHLLEPAVYYINECYKQLSAILSDRFKPVNLDKQAMEAYTARTKAQQQVDFFNRILERVTAQTANRP